MEIEKLTVRKDRGDFSAAWTQGVREATCQLGEHRDEIGEGQLLWSALAPFEELDDDARRGSTSRRKTPRSRIQWVACPGSQRISRFLAGAGSMRTPWELTGIAGAGKSTRTPDAVDRSGVL